MITVRVYGILINDQKQILVSDELIRGAYITKFCGGGLEEGEGTRACLKREFMEELNLEVEVQEHFYTTDFYQPSAFRVGDQILSIYYKVKANTSLLVNSNKIPFQFSVEQILEYDKTMQIESYRWIDLQNFTAQDMTLPIDKIVANMVISTK